MEGWNGRLAESPASYGAFPVDADGKPLDCTHSRQEPRLQTIRGGSQRRVYQCLECGAAAQVVKKDEHAARAAAARNSPFDEKLRSNYEERRSAAWSAYSERQQREWDRQRSQENAQWWAEYNAYLDSWEWQERRAKVLERDGYRCQARLSACFGQAEQVHHLTYNHLGDEPLFELISVCGPCHDRITAMDRERPRRGKA